MSDIDREPIFWTSTRPGYNQRDREIVRFENGKRIVEKVPQRGHQGDYDNRRIDRRCAAARWIHVVTHHGNAIRMVLTNGASHLDPNTEWGQYQRAKARYFGWYPVACCPLALVTTGDLRRDQIVNQAMLSERPCEHGTYSEANRCKHNVAEQQARQVQHAADELERFKSYMDATQKQIEANRADVREQTAAITQAITAALGGDTEKPARAAKRKAPPPDEPEQE